MRLDQSQTIKAAFTTWENRIAPVFEVARQVHIVETNSGRIVGEAQEALLEDMPVQRALRLAELGVQALVCGAISRPDEALVEAYGIRVIPFVAGELREVIQAWISGELKRDLYSMPGCHRRDRRGRRAAGMNQEVVVDRGVGRKGRGSGGGRGQGRGGQGQGRCCGKRGRMGGPLAGGPDRICKCPECGHQQVHERGSPCTQKRCPQCGAAMSRQ